MQKKIMPGPCSPTEETTDTKRWAAMFAQKKIAVILTFCAQRRQVTSQNSFVGCNPISHFPFILLSVKGLENF